KDGREGLMHLTAQRKKNPILPIPSETGSTSAQLKRSGVGPGTVRVTCHKKGAHFPAPSFLLSTLEGVRSWHSRQKTETEALAIGPIKQRRCGESNLPARTGIRRRW